MRTEDFDYTLPEELIAQSPPKERTASRLLYLANPSGRIVDTRFAELPSFLERGDLTVFNDTRVIKARLAGTRESGGRVEFLVERICDETTALAHGRASNPMRAGTVVDIGEGASVEIEGREGDLYRIRFSGASLSNRPAAASIRRSS